MAKISIITVNLNNLEGLKKTAESILNQSYRNYEFLVIDGSSDDGSKDYLLEISSKLTHFISEPDKGIYSAMNKGIKIAKGDYIYFLNSGDIFFDSDTLSEVVEKMDDGLDLYYGDLVYNWPKGVEYVHFPKELSYQFFVIDNINHQACFIKRSLFERFFYYNENYKIISDWEFLIFTVCKGEISYKHLEIMISIYDTSGISTNVKNRQAIYADKEEVIKKHFPLFAFDHKEIAEMRLKRVKQFFFIKKHKTAYRILKWCMSVILIFLPKPKFDSKY